MKNLNELNGVKILSKNEQKAITGGLACVPEDGYYCPVDMYCCIDRLACYTRETFLILCH